MYQTSYGEKNYRYEVQNHRGGTVAETNDIAEARALLKTILGAYAVYDNAQDTTIAWR